MRELFIMRHYHVKSTSTAPASAPRGEWKPETTPSGGLDFVLHFRPRIRRVAPRPTRSPRNQRTSGPAWGAQALVRGPGAAGGGGPGREAVRLSVAPDMDRPVGRDRAHRKTGAADPDGDDRAVARLDLRSFGLLEKDDGVPGPVPDGVPAHRLLHPDASFHGSGMPVAAVGCRCDRDRAAHAAAAMAAGGGFDGRSVGRRDRNAVSSCPCSNSSDATIRLSRRRLVVTPRMT